MTTPDTTVLELETRIETTSGAVDAWALLVVLADELGLAHGLPPLAAPDSSEIRDMELSGPTWTGSTARLLITPTAGGGVMVLLASSGGTDEADEDHLHDTLLMRAGDWLDERHVRWRYRQPSWCAPDAWHCGWRAPTGHRTPQTTSSDPVGGWRRRIVRAVDWATLYGAFAVVGLAGLAVLGGKRARVSLAHGGLLGQSAADLLRWAGPATTAVALLAAVVLARRVADVVAVVLAPDEPDDWPHRWWARLAAVIDELAVVLLLAATVIALGGGWLA
ncbi:hypothetical protein [Candidatus Frankia nodulisporulans]|uniref:hypothetical protein n=1 Tax=Candidatus Frankia nodulisporulans TaxID=2060052 RepID=UPI0013D6448D|nr:hypothetical protein [Candidatus Frankia nodulisporulans]